MKSSGKKLWIALCTALPCLGGLVLTGCGDDDYVYPSVRTDLVELQTDATGTARTLVTDGGEHCSIRGRMGLDGLTPDTLYRVVSQYEVQQRPNGEEAAAPATAVVYSAQLAVAPLPIPAAQVTELHEDPVDLQSLSRRGRYLNLILQVKVKDQKHVYQFIDQGMEDKGTHRILHLRLYHDRQGDAEAFHRTVYASVPLWPYADTLQPTDSVEFHFTTYREGKTSRRFAVGTLK